MQRSLPALDTATQRGPVGPLDRDPPRHSEAATIPKRVVVGIAGLLHDTDEVKGLSGLLGELAGNPWGQVALWVIAIGTFAYGVFTLIEAKYRRAY